MRDILFRAKGVEEDDKNKWYEGYYWYTKDTVYCFKEDYDITAKEGKDPRHHYILMDGFADWGMPVPKYKAEINPETLCQYTGLPDKNSKKIWENDITKLVLPDGEIRYFKVSFKKVIGKVLCHPDFDDDVAKVELNAICFEWNGYELFPCIDENGVSDISKMEVVGNIFDNPELLEVEQ